MAEESKNYQVKIRNLDNELTSVKNELNSLRGDLQKNKDKYKTELDNNSKICEALQKELDEQKDKNNVSLFNMYGVSLIHFFYFT